VISSNQKLIDDLLRSGIANQNLIDALLQSGIANQKLIDDRLQSGIANQNLIGDLLQSGIANQKRIDDLLQSEVPNQILIDRLLRPISFRPAPVVSVPRWHTVRPRRRHASCLSPVRAKRTLPLRASTFAPRNPNT